MADAKETQNSTDGIKLNGLYAFKIGMSSIYNSKGEVIPVTVLKVEPWVITQVKTKVNDGYEAVQVACRPKTSKRALKSEKGHFKNTGFENGASFVGEIRQGLNDTMTVGTKVSLDSLAKGDSVKLTGVSKGKGFQGVIRRWSFAGGPAAHGSKFHRQPGSVGNRTWPGRVMPGRKLPGHWGDETVTLKNVEIVDVIHDESVVLVKGPVPGARNSLVKLMKV